MWFLRLAKLLHSHFQTRFLFGTKMKSTYENILQNTKTLDLSAKQGSQCPIQVLGLRQKWVNLPPTFFEFFINFPILWHLLLNIQKNLSSPFSVLARYGPFWLWTWPKNENFEIFHKIQNDHLTKTNDLCFMKNFKIFIFWPCPKSKWAIFCQNGKRASQIFLNIQ